MKTIEERARQYAYNLKYGYYTAEEAYIIGAKEQRLLTIYAFDKWLCENSQITRDENNRHSLAKLRNIIESI